MNTLVAHDGSNAVLLQHCPVLTRALQLAQVSTLQQQVAALQSSRDTQDKELSRLRNEALQLASRAAASEARGAAAERASSAVAGQSSAVQSAAMDQVGCCSGGFVGGWTALLHLCEIAIGADAMNAALSGSAGLCRAQHLHDLQQ